MSCPDPDTLVENEINRVLTQYRESPKLLHLMRTYLGEVAQVLGSICDIPSHFDLANAIGDQLTLLGKRLGWPRCHCVCNVQPVFGFDCGTNTDLRIITGFCAPASTWDNCGPFGTSDICITDDEIYRTFLKARRYQMLALFDLESLNEVVKILWGDAATVLASDHRRVVIAPGRALTASETSLLQIYPRVLPVAPGVAVRFHFDTEKKVFGFGEGWGGFCEEWEPGGLPFVTEEGETLLVTDDDGNEVPLMTGPLFRDAPWMCEVNTHPYDCL